MGICLIVPGADFSSANLGKVTLAGYEPITGLAISGADTVLGTSSQYLPIYTPTNTSQRDVVWSVTAGSQYATISQQGLLAVKPGASANNVTIQAASVSDPSLVATKTVSVTYTSDVLDLGIQSWQQGEMQPDGTINPGTGSIRPWGTVATAFDVTGVSRLVASVPASKQNFILEVLYFDSTDTNVGGAKYLYIGGTWSRFPITVDQNVPSGATKVYFSCAIDAVNYSPTQASGVTVAFV